MTPIAAQNRTAEFGVWDMGTLVWLVGRWLVGEDDGVCVRAATTVNLGNMRLVLTSDFHSRLISVPHRSPSQDSTPESTG